ncbi:MAG: NAD(P)-dependent oxidoreductase [bacterium]|nr:NAD(P)-dependent oxidoreductase [bacterium]
MNVLVTGGTGLIGSRVARLLVATGHRAVLLDNAPRPLDAGSTSSSIVTERASIEALHDVIRIIKAHAIDVIVHLAGMLGGSSEANPLTASHINVVGTMNVFEAARLCAVRRIVSASSMVVFGSDDEYGTLPITDDSPRLGAKRAPMYSAGKIYMEMAAELYRERYGVMVVGLRPSIVYGAGRESGATAFASELIENPALGKPAHVASGNAYVSMVYVDDVAAAFCALAFAPETAFERHRFFNTGGDRCRIRDIADAVMNVIPGASITVECGEERDVMGYPSRIADNALREEVGFTRRYTPLATGIGAYIDAVRGARG